MAQTKKTNNSYFGNKVELRCNYLPENPVVLDCYAGAGLIWKAVEYKTGIKIKYVGIDVIDYGVGFYLTGDNMSYLQTMDLTRFNVIDLDAYGVPYEQLKTIFGRGYSGRVFVTFIQSLYGQMPVGLLEEIGFTNGMVEKIPTLFGKNGWNYFIEWLALNGVRAITHRSNGRKHYLTFISGTAELVSSSDNRMADKVVGHA